MTFAGLALLICLALFLIQRFDSESNQRESQMVHHGFARQLAEFDDVVATQLNWDDAVHALDNTLDLDWADFNIGNYLYTFNGFTHAFVIDRDAKPIYAAINGGRAGIDKYDQFAPAAAQLIPAIRKAEAKRPPLKRRAGQHNIIIPAINARTFAVVNGQVYYVNATLVQPDFGVVLPKTARAPVAILAKPVDAAMLKNFAERYLLEGLRLEPRVTDAPDLAHLPLHNDSGEIQAALAWTPQQPGTTLERQLALPFLVWVAMLGVVAWTILRRGSGVVRELVMSESRAKHLAYHDPLTRLPNRAMLFEHLHRHLAAIRTDAGGVGVLCVDLDRFKEVNDTLGHHAGDALIETVANRLRQVCENAALVARLGGDEFVVLLEGTDLRRAECLAEDIIKAVRMPVHTEHGRIEVGCSVGVAVIDHAGVEASEALRWADLALYSAKEKGRMCASIFEPEMDLALRNRRSLEADLRQAIGDGSLSMVYQPQVDRRGKVIAVEALVRWNHPVRGMIPPSVFIPLAEECGLIVRLGETVMRQVFSETGHWNRLRVAINVSAVQLRTPGFAALVMRLGAQAGIDPSRYEIEVTETSLLGEDQTAITNIEALKRLGFSIALDDFGTGYSSLSLLQRFSVDKIKIDRTFVSGLGDCGESEELVDAMVKLARALNLSVIAEGVETELQMDRLMASGCREFQGHLTGMPMPIRELSPIIGERFEAAAAVLKRRG